MKKMLQKSKHNSKTMRRKKCCKLTPDSSRVSGLTRLVLRCPLVVRLVAWIWNHFFLLWVWVSVFVIAQHFLCVFVLEFVMFASTLLLWLQHFFLVFMFFSCMCLCFYIVSFLCWELLKHFLHAAVLFCSCFV